MVSTNENFKGIITFLCKSNNFPRSTINVKNEFHSKLGKLLFMNDRELLNRRNTYAKGP